MTDTPPKHPSDGEPSRPGHSEPPEESAAPEDAGTAGQSGAVERIEVAVDEDGNPRWDVFCRRFVIAAHGEADVGAVVDLFIEHLSELNRLKSEEPDRFQRLYRRIFEIIVALKTAGETT